MAEQTKQDNQETKENIQDVSSNSKMKWAILIFSLIIAITATIIISRYLLWPKFKKFREQRETTKQEKQVKEVKKLGPIHTIGDLTVNPYGSNGLRFVIAEVALEAGSEEMLEEIEQREPQLKDLLIRYFREKSTNQILAPHFQDSSAHHLKRQINERLYESQIDSLYYLKLVVQ